MLLSRKTLSTLALLSGTLVACADLPDRQLVIEHRILAAQVAVTMPLDPNEPLEPSRNQVLPLETARITPFVVGPSGAVDAAAIAPMWIACELFPGGGPFACIENAIPLAPEDLPDCVSVTPDDLATGVPDVASPCLLSREGAPELTVPPSQGVLGGADYELILIGGPPGGTTTQRCATELLAGVADTPDDCLYGVQVVSVGPKPLLFQLADQFGVDLGDIETPAPDEVDAPDLNPRITSFRVSVVDNRGNELRPAQEVAPGEVITAKAGDILRIDTTSPVEDLQPFRIPTNNGATFEDQEEAYTGDWLRTWGEQLSPSSGDPESYNEWTLRRGDQDDTDLPPDGIAHMYYVLRDTRGGVNWWWFSVEVTE